MLRLLVGYLCTKREYNIYRDCSDVVRPPAASYGVSWLIFEPRVSKIAYESTLVQSTFIYTTAPNPIFFGHNIRVRLGCGLRKSPLGSVVWQMRFAVCMMGVLCGRGALCAVCLFLGDFGLGVRPSLVALIGFERFV